MRRGGTGKSNIAASLATALALQGRRVVALDRLADPEMVEMRGVDHDLVTQPRIGAVKELPEAIGGRTQALATNVGPGGKASPSKDIQPQAGSRP